MSKKKSNRNINKELRAIEANNRNEFSKITENLVSIASNHSFNYEALEVVEVYIKLNVLWKTYSRKLINSNLIYYNTQKKRIDLIHAFESFYKDIKTS